MGKKASISRVIRGLLRDNGLRWTATRQRVLETLIEAGEPLSHQDVMDRIDDETVDRVTVYRTLERLCEIGLVHRALAGKRARLYESSDRCFPDHCHAHFSCRRCGQTTCLVESTVTPISDLPVGFVSQRQKVLVEGLCSRCSRTAGI